MVFHAKQHQRQRRRQFIPALTSNEVSSPIRPSPNGYILAIARAALKLVAGASIATSAVLALQLVWIVLKTPRLPPPPLSGVDFVREGRVLRVDGGDDGNNNDDEKSDNSGDDDSENNDFIGDIFPGKVSMESIGTSHDNDTISISNRSGARRKRKEFRLVLVGDSPVEGIGNAHHDHALGGQTARAIAHLVCGEEGYDRVRYWSHGKSGLTARGIEEEMAPLLHRVAHDHDGSGADDESSSEPAIHAIILLCGVNNVLDPLSTTSSFHSEVRSLLTSIRGRKGLEQTPLIVLGLPDFARLPFLPWPLGFVLGLRGRRMQRALEMAVKEFRQLDERRCGNTETIIVNIPEVQDVVGSIGYHRHDSTSDGSKNAQIEKTKAEPLEMRLCHPLLKYLGGGSLDQTKLGSLGIEDFLCDDGFHPGGHGTVYIGNLIAEAYGRLMNLR